MIRARLRAPRLSMVGDAADAIAAGEAVGRGPEGDALRFQDLYYNERKHIEHLDSQRRASFEDVVAESQDAQPA